MPFGVNPSRGSSLAPSQLAAQRAVGETEMLSSDNIYKRSERSIVAFGLVASPTAGQVICQIPGFQSAKQFAVYRLDWSVLVEATTGVACDMAIFLGGIHYLTLVHQATASFPPVSGTVFIAPNGGDVDIRAIAGSDASYAASLVMTRLVDGFQVG